MCCCSSALPARRRPAVFQTNSEYGARSFINGKARPGEHVIVSFGAGFGTLGSGQFPAVADAHGDWEVEFNRGGVGHGPGTVTVSGEDGPPIVARNVMGGDVYHLRIISIPTGILID
eukprot:COSAG01_NODE_819_length_13340_cov_133.198172_4_plen_117_part_00